MKLTPDQLPEENRVAVLEHSQLVAFIRPYMKPSNGWMLFFWGFNLLVVVAIITNIFISDKGFSGAIGWFTGGFALFFIVLLPLHEAIHGAAYKILGAPHVSFSADFRRMIFFALADKFVVNQKEFTFVAILPFFIINTLLIAGAIFLPYSWSWVCLGALFVHSGGCSGDFALVSYFHEHRHMNLVTYDEIETSTSYFFTNK